MIKKERYLTQGNAVDEVSSPSRARSAGCRPPGRSSGGNSKPRKLKLKIQNKIATQVQVQGTVQGAVQVQGTVQGAVQVQGTVQGAVHGTVHDIVENRLQNIRQ